MNNYTISMIENLCEQDARNMCTWHMQIKGHDIYFVDFGGYFGYSALVFLNGGHVHYANDYALHHPGMSEDELDKCYKKHFHRILFTGQELISPSRDYDEAKRKDYYLRNYYVMQKPYVSMFGTSPADTSGMLFNEISLCYMKPEYKDFIGHQRWLYVKMKECNVASETDFEYLKSAFLSEMYNHEYGINWQADYDVLSAFDYDRSLGWHEDDIETYFRELGFNSLQRQAYYAARKEYFADEEN